MAAVLIQGPAIEPLSLADAKLFLRVAHADDDDLIAALIAAAREEVERATRRLLIRQNWRIVLDRWPASARIVSPANPLAALTAARVRAADGTSAELALSAFTLDTASVPGVIAFERANVAEPGRAIAGIELDVATGYGDTAAAVPAPLIQAIRLLTARFYEHRDRIEGDKLIVARMVRALSRAHAGSATTIGCTCRRRVYDARACLLHSARSAKVGTGFAAQSSLRRLRELICGSHANLLIWRMILSANQFHFAGSCASDQSSLSQSSTGITSGSSA
jgi:uncharacterized phiE125 gp8 family phage protein